MSIVSESVKSLYSLQTRQYTPNKKKHEKYLVKVGMSGVKL